VFAIPACSAVSERSPSVAGLCLNVALLSQSTDDVDNILFMHMIGLILQIPITYRTVTILTILSFGLLLFNN